MGQFHLKYSKISSRMVRELREFNEYNSNWGCSSKLCIT